MSNLDPAFTIGSQLVEPMRVSPRHLQGRGQADARSTCSPGSGIPNPERTFAAYPHEISGGMAQRVLIAGAVSCDPDLLIADEPTTALDVTVQAEVLDLLRDLQAELHMGVLIVTHNFGVVADLCDRVSVMRDGRIVETGPARPIFADPQPRVHPVAARRDPRGQQAARRTRGRPPTPPSEAPTSRHDPRSHPMTERLLDVDELVVEYPGKGFRAKPFRALHGVSLDIRPRRDRRPGRRVRLRQDHARPGRARPRPGHRRRRSVRRPRHQPPPAHGASGAVQRHQVVFQDPYTSLNPSMTIEQILTEPLTVPNVSRGRGHRAGRTLLDQVHLPGQRRRPAAARVHRRPAPADRHRPRAGALAQADRLRRAGLGARPVHPGPGARPVPGDPGAHRRRLPVRLPRPRRGPPHQPPGRRDVPAARSSRGATATRSPASPQHPYTQRLFLASPVARPRAAGPTPRRTQTAPPRSQGRSAGA